MRISTYTNKPSDNSFGGFSFGDIFFLNRSLHKIHYGSRLNNFNFFCIKNIALFFTVISLLTLSLPNISSAEISSDNSLINLSVIKQIESSGNPLARNFNCIGLYQISPSVLKEYNTTHKTHYRSVDLYNANLNTKIARWYLTEQLPKYLHHFDLPVSIENLIISYNCGIGNCVKYRKGLRTLPKETRDYLKKYASLA